MAYVINPDRRTGTFGNPYAKLYQQIDRIISWSEQKGTIKLYGYTGERGNQPNGLDRMLEWLRLNYDRHLLIADVTQRFNYNEDYFSRVFRKRTGVYFADYMNRLRIR